MRAAPAGSEARTTAFVVLAAALCAAAFYYSLVAGAASAGYFSDAVDYLFFADYLRGSDSRAAQIVHDTTRFPPLYPMLLAAAGAGTDALPRAHALVGALAVVLVAWTAVLARQLGAGRYAALGAAATVLFAPVFVRLVLELASEPAFTVLALSAVSSALAAQRAADRGRARGAVWLGFAAGLFAASSLLARDAGIALASATALWAVVHRRIGALAGLGLGAVAYVIWRAARAHYPVGTSYGEVVAHVLASFGAGDGISQLAAQAGSLATAWLDVGGFERATGALVMVPLTLLALRSALPSLRRVPPDLGFIALTLPMLVVWPYPGEFARLLAPLLPFVAARAWHGATLVGARSRTAGMAAAVALAAGPAWLAAMLLPRLAWTVPAELAPYAASIDRYLAPDRATLERSAERRLRIALAAADIPRHASAGARVCAAAPAYAMLHAAVPIASVQALGAEAPAVPAAIAPECDFVFVAAIDYGTHGLPPLYPAAWLERAGYRPVLVSRMSPPGPEIAAALFAAPGQAR